MYQALYRKWRPQTFADVVGQPAITDTLRAQIIGGRFSHAYLFAGSRGTGKTTCAKILAKAVNCEAPINGDPCNKCPSCLGISSGQILDVVEIDAASNTGVDGVRELRDEAIYSPANVKKRVYIIDEVHMFSNSAFNALLKIMEEPPEHVLFILATTELHKVPATILSRCQRFTFKRIDSEDIKARILYIAQSEGILIDDDAAAFIARLCDGGMRDALSIFDQCAAYGEASISVSTVENVVGITGSSAIEALVDAIADKDSASALNQLSDLYNGGRDLVSLLGELSAYFRDLLVEKVAEGAKINRMNVSVSATTLAKQMAEFGENRLISMISTISNTLSTISASANKRIDAEICIVKLCTGEVENAESVLLQRVEELERKLANGFVQPVEKRQISAEKPVVKPVENVEKPVIPTEKPPAEEAKPCPPMADIGADWLKIIEGAKGELSPGIIPFLKSVKATQNGGNLQLFCKDEMSKNILKQPGLIKKLEVSAEKIYGRTAKISIGEENPAKEENDEFSKLCEKLKNNDNVTIIGGE